MGQRNMLYSSPIIDLELDQQGQGHLHPEPCILYRSITSFPQPNIHTILPAPEHHGAITYGMNQYNAVPHHHYNMYMTAPSSSTVFPIQLSHGPHDQLPFSSNHGIVEASVDSYGRNSHFMDGVGGAFKRKNAEGISGNFHYSYASAGSSSSSVAPMNARPLESDVALMDGSSFALPEYRGNDISQIMEVGSHRSAMNRSGGIGIDSVLAHNTNHLIQGNHLGQPFQTAATPWLSQQFNSNGSDVGTLSWNQAPALSYLHGSINGGCMETANMCMQGYQVTASSRSSTPFMHPPIPQGHPNLHHLPPPPMQGTRGHNIDFHSQVATSSRRLPTNSTSHTGTSSFQEGLDVGPRFVGPVPPTGFRIYRPHRRDVTVEATPRQRNVPHLRVLPEDGVAILEISGYHEVGDSIDHHRDMRLDIDHMSYEELLALGEHIGSVGTGLSEEIIISRLKTRMFVSSTSCSNLKERTVVDQEPNFCVICQADYKNQEKIGVLNCGHEYHVDCIKKWLLVKNTCPICKSSALATERRHDS